MNRYLAIIFTFFSLTANSPKKVIVLGGDGFCGWPTALYLSDSGYDVSIVDNLSRRKISQEIGAESLTPIASIEERLETWRILTGKAIPFHYLDIAKNYDALVALISREKPDVIVHFAEQRSAPYSMKSADTRRYTVDNNLSGTHNVLSAIIDSKVDSHLVHLGTMGVYGYEGMGEVIPEGYLKIPADNEQGYREIIYPPDPASIYHMTKCQDALFFYYYNKNYSVRITDLHQGIIWGTNTEQTKRHPALINRFDYDSDYGTVLNRFLVQATIGHPLTIYGKGYQTRAFIHIRDMVQCIKLAIEAPPSSNERVKIINQMTEVYRLVDLAEKIASIWGCSTIHLENPRKEKEDNELRVTNQTFLDLGLNPTTLSDGLLEEIVGIAKKYSDRVDHSKIPPLSFWRNK